MKSLCNKSIATGLAICLWASLASAQNFSDIKPSAQQTAWQDLEFGVIIHFSTNTFLDREWGDGTADPSVFNPTAFDPDQWMKAIRDSGAKYVVLVAKHHDGFCLWPTEQTAYSIKSSPWKGGKGDVVGDVARAARKYGLQFGVYLSPWDRHEPKYKDSTAYDAYYQSELSELASSYGDLVEFWLDGAGSAGHVYNFQQIIETLRTYQPNTIVFADTGLFEYGDARSRLLADVIGQFLVIKKLRGKVRVAGITPRGHFIEKYSIHKIVLIHSIDFSLHDFRVSGAVAGIGVSQNEDSILACGPNRLIDARIVVLVIPVIEVNDHDPNRLRSRLRPGRPLQRAGILIGGCPQTHLRQRRRRTYCGESKQDQAENAAASPHDSPHGALKVRNDRLQAKPLRCTL